MSQTCVFWLAACLVLGICSGSTRQECVSVGPCSPPVGCVQGPTSLPPWEAQGQNGCTAEATAVRGVASSYSVVHAAPRLFLERATSTDTVRQTAVCPSRTPADVPPAP